MDTVSWNMKELALDEINDAPGPCCMSFGFDLSPLVRSIEQVGLINPPLLEERGEGQPVVICGYRRILALKTLGRKTSMARFTETGSRGPQAALLINLFDNLATRALNNVEKAMVLSRLSHFLSRDELLDRFMPLLALPRRTDVLSLYLAIDRELDSDTKRLVIQENVGLRAVEMLLRMEAGRRKAFFRLFEDVALNVNQQAEVIELVEDLSRIRNVPPDGVLGSAKIVAILSEYRGNGPQRVKALLAALREMRFPQLMAAEHIFKARVARLALPSGTRISHPPFFEDPNYRMEILFRDGHELMERLRHLAVTAPLEALSNPWEMESGASL